MEEELAGEREVTPGHVRVHADEWILGVRRMAPMVVRAPSGEAPRDLILEWAALVQLLFVAARRLRRSAGMGVLVGIGGQALVDALRVFDEACPDLVKIRDVGEHFDEGARGAGRHRLDPPLEARPAVLIAAAEVLYGAIVAATAEVDIAPV